MGKKTFNPTIWVLPILALFSLMGSRALMLLIPIGIVVLALRRAAAERGKESSPSEQTSREGGQDKPDGGRWTDARPAEPQTPYERRSERRREFDTQRARQSGYGERPSAAQSAQDEYESQVQGLKDLLAAGIIEHGEYSERMAALRGERRR